MSKYYKVDVRGKNWLQRVNGLPGWTAEDEGRILYDLANKGVFFGDNVGWVAAGQYNDVPLNTILLVESDTAITGYTLLTNKDDSLVYISKGSGAGGESGGTDKASGTWTQPGHTHNAGSHTHTVASHSHPIGSHVHTYSGNTAYAYASVAAGGNNATGTHRHAYSGTTDAASGSTGTSAPATGNNTGYTLSSSATANTWRPKGRNFTRQQRT